MEVSGEVTTNNLPFPSFPTHYLPSFRPSSHTPALNTSTLVQKLWNYCNVLRDDGMSYGDYVEQPTYLLFLKMADMAERGALDGYFAPPLNAAERAIADLEGWILGVR